MKATPVVNDRVNEHRVSASWRDYLELCKPKVVALMLLTSVVGMLLATYSLPSWEALILGNLGIALMAGSAAAINHVVDQRIDVHMARTRNRPLAVGKVDSLSALIFAAVIGLLGMLVLLVWVNALTAWLTFSQSSRLTPSGWSMNRRTTPPRPCNFNSRSISS